MEPIGAVLQDTEPTTPTSTPTTSPGSDEPVPEPLPLLSARLTELFQQANGPDWRLHLEPDREPEPAGCGTCNGTGWLVVRHGPAWEPGHPDFGKARPCPDCKADELEQQRVSRIFGAAEIPPLLAGLDFATYRAQEGSDQLACDGMEQWAREGAGSVYLWGKVGRGKTGLAVSAMRYRIAARGTAALFRPTPELLGRIRDTFSHNPEAPTEDEVVSAVQAVPLLILDDLGVDKPTEWVIATLYRVLNRRWLDQRATIFTSNYDLKHIGQTMGARIATRIQDMCEPNILEVVGANLRAKS